MSSHVLDLSGQRQTQVTLNDPAVTRFYVPAKPGDDAEFSFSGREVRIALGSNAKLQRRIVTVQKPVRGEDGKLVENGEGGYVTEEATETRLVLVLGSGVSGFIRSSLTPEERSQEAEAGVKVVHEMHTHTQVVVKRKGDKDEHYLEAGVIETEVELLHLLHDFENPEV